MVRNGVAKSGQTVRIQQGVEINRPSQIFARADKQGEKILNVCASAVTPLKLWKGNTLSELVTEPADGDGANARQKFGFPDSQLADSRSLPRRPPLRGCAPLMR